MENPKTSENIDDGKRILDLMGDFTEEYNVPPLDSYISYFDISTVDKFDTTASAEEGSMPCFVVKLRESLPQGVEIPGAYREIPVFVI